MFKQYLRCFYKTKIAREMRFLIVIAGRLTTKKIREKHRAWLFINKHPWDKVGDGTESKEL